MTNPNAQLKSLIALKRRGAEQRLQVLCQTLARLDQSIASLIATLSDLNAVEIGFEVRRLAVEQGTVDRLLSRIYEARGARTALIAEIEAARHALKRAIHSEERIAQMIASG